MLLFQTLYIHDICWPVLQHTSSMTCLPLRLFQDYSHTSSSSLLPPHYLQYSRRLECASHLCFPSHYLCLGHYFMIPNFSEGILKVALGKTCSSLNLIQFFLLVLLRSFYPTIFIIPPLFIK